MEALLNERSLAKMEQKAIKAIARFMSVKESTVAATLNDAFKKLEIPQSDDINTRVRGVTTWLGIAGIPPAEPWSRESGR